MSCTSCGGALGSPFCGHSFVSGACTNCGGMVGTAFCKHSFPSAGQPRLSPAFFPYTFSLLLFFLLLIWLIHF